MTEKSLMTFEEKISYKLRSLYSKYGYLSYKMGKFEEYELYIRNKEFLVSDKVIAFNDTNGKLMALKPDVTLSIIKNGEDEKGYKQKVFYNENVYRVSETTHCFKEIMQTGLECIGDIDLYDIYEVISLAAQSLESINSNYFIEISNLDFVISVINSVCDDNDFLAKAMNCISEKNPHDLKRICEKYGISDNGYNKLSNLVSVYGNRDYVISELSKTFNKTELTQLCSLSEMLDNSIYSDRIKFDFSVVNDMNYYNGFVFKGFLDGVSCDVLAGGQYDNMMKKMSRNSCAVGFAIYLDSLGDLFRDNERYDVDCLLIYDNSVSFNEVQLNVNRQINKGFSVTAQKIIPEKLRYKKVIDLRKKG